MTIVDVQFNLLYDAINRRQFDEYVKSVIRLVHYSYKYTFRITLNSSIDS